MNQMHVTTIKKEAYQLFYLRVCVQINQASSFANFETEKLVLLVTKNQ